MQNPVTANVLNTFDGLPEGDAANWNGWLDVHSEGFDDGVLDLRAKVQDAFEKLKSDPSNPTYLAQYQSALSEYNLIRMAQSNSTKNLADMQKQNIRNLS
jgi:type III secretion protein F